MKREELAETVINDDLKIQKLKKKPSMIQGLYKNISAMQLRVKMSIL